MREIRFGHDMILSEGKIKVGNVTRCSDRSQHASWLGETVVEKATRMRGRLKQNLP